MKSCALILTVLAVATSLAAGPRTDRQGAFSESGQLREPLSGLQQYGLPQAGDTIYYDDGYGYWYSTSGNEWGVRFTTSLPCTLHSVLTMSFGSGSDCTLFVRNDISGLPGPIVEQIAYQGGAWPSWDVIDLPVPYYDMNSFWVTGRYPRPPYILADSINNGGRSYHTFDGVNWLDYSYNVSDGLGGVIPNTIRMPIIEARTVQTQITIYDGETVVMGGIMRDTTTSTDDRIPILGDLPLIGRAFRTKYVDKAKANLLITSTSR